MTLHRAIIGSLLLLLLAGNAPRASAQASMFDIFFADALAETRKPVIVDDKLTEFVIREMEDWEQNGILLYPSDIRAAQLNDLGVLCSDKLDYRTFQKLEFDLGGLTEGVGCDSLKNAILSLIDTEVEIGVLGDNLTIIANGGSLAFSDQPNRPANIGFSTLLTTRIWAGTGTAILSWPDSANDHVENRLIPELAEDGVDDDMMWRYQHGYFRQKRENDPDLHAIDLDRDGDGYTVGMALEELAGILNIRENAYTKKGEFVVPKMGNLKNVGLWARADDLGLMWIYPNHFMRMHTIEAADEYPEYNEQLGDRLAYPFTYAGNASLPDDLRSPLCSRSAAGLGYVCRNVPEPVENCASPDTEDELNLIRCDQEERVTIEGPEICHDIDVLFADDGTPLWNPSDPREINPALTSADVENICSPGKKVMYKDEIIGHSCYIAFCVAQSHKGHTLVTNRSPNLVSEATSPYLACMRQDPHLGLYAELAQMTPFALPVYVGHHLAQEYEREYCGITGLPPHPLAGYCGYRENRRFNSPLYTFEATTNNANEELRITQEDQEIYVGDAAVIGYRAALDQWIPVQRKLVGSIAKSIQETATLLRELRRAPLTKTPCPWTGPFPRSAPSSS